MAAGVQHFQRALSAVQARERTRSSPVQFSRDQQTTAAASASSSPVGNTLLSLFLLFLFPGDAIQLELEMVYAPLASPASASSAPPPLKLIRLTSVTSSSSSRSFSFSTEFWRWFQCLAAPGDAQLTRVKSRATSAAAVKQKTD